MTQPVCTRELCRAVSRQIDRVSELHGGDKSGDDVASDDEPGDDVIDSIVTLLVTRENATLIAALFTPSSESWRTGTFEEACRVWGLLGGKSEEIPERAFSKMLRSALSDEESIKEVDDLYTTTTDEEEENESCCHRCRPCVERVSDDDDATPCMRGKNGSLTGPLSWAEFHVLQLSKPLESRHASWWVLIGLRPPTDVQWWGRLEMLPPSEWRYLGGGVGADADKASIRSDLHAAFTNVFTSTRSKSLGADLTSGRCEALSGIKSCSNVRTVRPLQSTPYIQVRPG